MNIIIAEHAGFCFGVKRAIDKTENALKVNKGCLYSYGPLIHNPQVVDELENRGLKQIQNIKDIPNGNIVIRAHGITKPEIQKMEELNINIIDGTCPYVKSVHKRVEEYMNKGYNIVIIGDKNHPEVVGINGWCSNGAFIVNNVEDIKKMPELDKICIVSQTTNTYEQFYKLSEEVKKKGQVVEVFNTICLATKNRQIATMELAKEVDAMIVIGGYESSNTLKLKEISEKFCKNVFHIERINELPLQSISKFNTIGVTAGASTPDWIIKEAIYTMDNFNDNEMMEAIENSFTRIHKGEIVTGEVIFVTSNEVMVNINYKSDGIISKDELSNDTNVNPKDLFKEGDKIDVYILKADDGEGNVVLSYKRVGNIKNMDILEEYFNSGKIIEGKVLRAVKGGLIVSVEGIEAFMPASLISVSFVKDMEKYKDTVIQAKIVDFDKKKRRIILSRKEIEKEELEVQREETWSKLKIGENIEGIVQRLTDFGAFVDLGGVDGLIHISDLSWNRVKHPSSILNPGDKVEVEILDLNKEKNRISLGLKQTIPKPWDEFEKNISLGDVVEGKVVNILAFGAFVRLNEGVDGLLHISQISKDHIESPSEILKVGETVKVKVIDIDLEEKRISLSIKEIEKEEKEEESLSQNKITEEENEPTIGDIINNK
ncbi:bifunctional 4-hydroxy-3-methylbut-2-enyl diphosphate reductase/30S ribosomal protein S1 [Tissierella creatinophila]|uniref:4-hydroxy-3-methylbut-2-enyl diphosphate reductase n=1 Tax=Tissierella creatinophila DSM 6911 TaxID=1123403 RepID=A0A1U7M9L1_TISCR|nr:bifunctional 4-hydroxy-3-methylbut-2-enyl diphosphate reductase/30S ribosomal protein S1 [Tissierella creatinophila]OLS03961.1 30S ribosomal protein S1 [Tissierella creatinophila DSM 6911]